MNYLKIGNCLHMLLPPPLILFHTNNNLNFYCNYFYTINCNSLIFKIGKRIGIVYTHVIFLIFIGYALVDLNVSRISIKHIFESVVYIGRVFFDCVHKSQTYKHITFYIQYFMICVCMSVVVHV